MQHKLFGVFYTLICFFGSMLLAFGAEFLVDSNSNNWVYLGLIVLSLFFLILGIVLCAKRKINLFLFYWEIIATEIILYVLIFPTGLFYLFIQNRIVHRWEGWFLRGYQWAIYPCIPALSFFLLAIITGIMDYIRYLSERRMFKSKEENEENKDKTGYLYKRFFEK